MPAINHKWSITHINHYRNEIVSSRWQRRLGAFVRFSEIQSSQYFAPKDYDQSSFRILLRLLWRSEKARNDNDYAFIKYLDSVPQIDVILRNRAECRRGGKSKSRSRRKASSCEIWWTVNLINVGSITYDCPLVSAKSEIYLSWPPSQRLSFVRHSIFWCGNRSAPTTKSPCYSWDEPYVFADGLLFICPFFTLCLP